MPSIESNWIKNWRGRVATRLIEDARLIARARSALPALVDGAAGAPAGLDRSDGEQVAKCVSAYSAM